MSPDPPSQPDSAQPTVPQRRHPFQMGIGMLLYIVLLIALVLGWWQDHQRMEDAQLGRWAEYALLADQTDASLRRLTELQNYAAFSDSPLMGHRFGRETEFPWDAEGYLQFLASIPNRQLNNVVHWEEQFEATAIRVADAPDDIYAEVLPKMLPFCDSSDVTIRYGMFIAVCREMKDPRNRIAPFRAEVLPMLCEMLEDSAPGVKDEAADALGEFGAEAKVAETLLEDLIRSENNAHAMLALCRIDESEANVGRVKAWIRDRKPDWEMLASSLSQVMPRKEAIAFLRQEYFRAEDDADQGAIADGIDRLEVDRLHDAAKEGQR